MKEAKTTKDMPKLFLEFVKHLYFVKNVHACEKLLNPYKFVFTFHCPNNHDLKIFKKIVLLVQ